MKIPPELGNRPSTHDLISLAGPPAQLGIERILAAGLVYRSDLTGPYLADVCYSWFRDPILSDAARVACWMMVGSPRPLPPFIRSYLEYHHPSRLAQIGLHWKLFEQLQPYLQPEHIADLVAIMEGGQRDAA